MTELEKKIKRNHNKKMKYRKDTDDLFLRLLKAEADKYDAVEEKIVSQYFALERTQRFPHRPNRKARVVSRILTTLLIILLIILITIWARYRFPDLANSVF